MISTAAAASSASSGSPPNASAERTTNRGRQRFPPVLNMYLMIWLASRLSKFAFNVLLIVFSMGSRQASSEGGRSSRVLSGIGELSDARYRCQATPEIADGKGGFPL